MKASINLNTASFGDPAVAYYRYSSHGQTEQSIEGQQAAARAYATAKGYNLIHEYVDRAMTGRNDDREQFQQMLTDAAKHQFKVIILWKVDRFGRNREEITFNKHRCRKHGVRVEYVAETVPQTPEGVILESVLEGMAEYYSLQLSQNVRRGMRVSASKAQSVGGNRPLGYKTGPDKKFIIDPATAPIVQQVYQLYAAGDTITDIIKKLNAQGLRTLRGRPFTRNSLRTMLTNEKYIGVYKYKDEVRIENAIPPLIDKDTFDAVQKMLKNNRRAPARKWSRADYLLTDKLFCGHCGSGMVGESGTSKQGIKYNYYLCTKHKKRQGCAKKAVRQDWIEKLVLDTTAKILQNDEIFDNIIEGTWAFYMAQDERQTRIKGYTSKLAEIDGAISNIIKAVEAGLFTPALTERMNSLNEQKTALQAALAAEELAQDLVLTKDMIRFFLSQFREPNIQDRNFQKRIVDTFINSIFVYDDRIFIAYNYRETNQRADLKEIFVDTTNNNEQDFVSEGFGRCAVSPTICPIDEHSVSSVGLFAWRVLGVCLPPASFDLIKVRAGSGLVQNTGNGIAWCAAGQRQNNAGRRLFLPASIAIINAGSPRRPARRGMGRPTSETDQQRRCVL